MIGIIIIIQIEILCFFIFATTPPFKLHPNRWRVYKFFIEIVFILNDFQFNFIIYYYYYYYSYYYYCFDSGCFYVFFSNFCSKKKIFCYYFIKRMNLMSKLIKSY
ncbi:hypothetical protein SSS_05330 [Sarcoptes scabiei]|nr:hypothetical protein SSS_05330 [Sarcoptes scabiei]